MGQKKRTGAVLVVEDEFLVLMMALDMIDEAGFEAIPAKNAAEALIVLEARSDIRIILTDINMPGSMDGLKLAHAVRGRWPPVEIIVTSALRLAGPLPERGRFLPKPYGAAELSEALHDLAA